MNNEFFLPPFVVNEYGPVLPQSQTIDWGCNVLNIPSIHKTGLKGKGIRVAVIDTGVDKDHPDLKGAIVEVINTTSEVFSASHGHGIGAAGIIGARDNNSGVLGVAPECEIYAIKSMRETGGGLISEIVAGIEAAIEREVDIINLSLGTSSNVSTFKNAIEKATKAGILVVCSAGNSGQDNSVVYPARYESTFAVGATNEYGKVSAFSSRGWEVDIAAPGERVLTTWRNKTYARVSGTSFSAPYVSGVFALFLEANMLVDHDRLKETAIDIESPGQDTRSGHGLIDPVTFINRYKNANTPTPSPVVPNPVDLDKVRKAHKLLGEFLNKK